MHTFQQDTFTDDLDSQEILEINGLDIFGLLSAFGTDLNPKECKFHFAKSPKQLDIDRFSIREEYKDFQSYQTARNFERKFIISFYQRGDSWMFAGVWKTISHRENLRDGQKTHFIYDTEFVESSAQLERRLVVQWPNRFRNSYPTGEKLAHGLKFEKILGLPDTLGHFPGYASVQLSLYAIKMLIENPSQGVEWEIALKNVPGIYMIADQSNGRLYVGAAYGENGLWQRWSAYAATGHGGNKQLMELVKDKGFDYSIENFVISLLWYGGAAVSDEDVFAKESFWKNALLTREFGNYNSN